MGILDKPTAPASPWRNGFAERLIGSIRRECLDHVIVLGEAHLRRILKSYARYYNGVRTHRFSKQSYAGFSAGSAIRSHKFARHLGRASPFSVHTALDQSASLRVGAGSPCPQSWDPAVARRFRALMLGLGPGRAW
ncbi:MAG: integrase core domain-containing protein [Pseudolabrys sp.]